MTKKITKGKSINVIFLGTVARCCVEALAPNRKFPPKNRLLPKGWLQIKRNKVNPYRRKPETRSGDFYVFTKADLHIYLEIKNTVYNNMEIFTVVKRDLQKSLLLLQR